MSSLIVSAILAVIITGVAGGLFNEFVWKKLRDSGASLISALVVSIGFSILFRYLMLYFFGGRAGFYRDYRIQEQDRLPMVHDGTERHLHHDLLGGRAVAVGIALQKTRAGKAMRAVADNRDLAESSGIDVEKVIRWVWVVGSALAGSVGCCSA